MSVYGYLCTDCQHPASDHGLAADSTDMYVCACGCVQPIDGAFAQLDRRQWDANVTATILGVQQ